MDQGVPSRCSRSAALKSAAAFQPPEPPAARGCARDGTPLGAGGHGIAAGDGASDGAGDGGATCDGGSARDARKPGRWLQFEEGVGWDQT